MVELPHLHYMVKNGRRRGYRHLHILIQAKISHDGLGHYWYRSATGQLFSLCTNTSFCGGIQGEGESEELCAECNAMYVDDLLHGRHQLEVEVPDDEN